MGLLSCFYIFLFCFFTCNSYSTPQSLNQVKKNFSELSIESPKSIASEDLIYDKTEDLPEGELLDLAYLSIIIVSNHADFNYRSISRSAEAFLERNLFKHEMQYIHYYIALTDFLQRELKKKSQITLEKKCFDIDRLLQNWQKLSLDSSTEPEAQLRIDCIKFDNRIKKLVLTYIKTYDSFPDYLPVKKELEDDRQLGRPLSSLEKVILNLHLLSLWQGDLYDSTRTYNFF